MRKPKNLIPIVAVLLLVVVATAFATTYYYEGTANGHVLLPGGWLHPMAEWDGDWDGNDNGGIFSGDWEDDDYGATGTFTGTVTSSYFTGTWSIDNVVPAPLGNLEGYVDADTAYGQGDAYYYNPELPAWGDWWSTSSW